MQTYQYTVIGIIPPDIWKLLKRASTQENLEILLMPDPLQDFLSLECVQLICIHPLLYKIPKSLLSHCCITWIWLHLSYLCMILLCTENSKVKSPFRLFWIRPVISSYMCSFIYDVLMNLKKHVLGILSVITLRCFVPICSRSREKIANFMAVSSNTFICNLACPSVYLPFIYGMVFIMCTPTSQEHCTNQVKITLMTTLLPDRVTSTFPSRETVTASGNRIYLFSFPQESFHFRILLLIC